MKSLILLVLLFIAACGTSSSDLSVLDKSSCNLPCWNGIITGQTSEDELLEILANIPNVDQTSIRIANQAWNIFDNQIFFSFHQERILSQRPSIEGEVRLLNGTVSDLIICGQINISMNRLVEEVGEPEHIISGNNIGGGRTVILINSQNGISYWYTASLSDLEITPDTQIDCIKIFDPLLFEQMLEAGFFSAGYYNAEETLRVWYPWNGYGNLNDKYPPRQP
jgi:hypothetical protein